MGLFDTAANLATLGGYGALTGSDTGQGGKNAGNIFNTTNNPRLTAKALGDNVATAINGGYSNQDYWNQVQKDPVLSGLFGKGGTLDQTVSQESDLANRGFSLQPEDYEAYGQAAGNIARMFGQNDQSLSQALSDRGLSSSGVANNAFAGSLGNKNEQLANIQMQIAQQRMQMNQQRLAQTQNFLSQLGNQGENALNSQFNRNIGQENAAMNRGKMAENYMKDTQDQSNENLSQYEQTNRPSLGTQLFTNFSGNFAGSLGKGLGSMMTGGGGQTGMSGVGAGG